MSLLKQLLVCSLLALVAAGGGWYVYQNPQMVGVARETPAGEGQGGGRANRIPGLSGAGGAVNVVAAPVAVDQGGETVTALGTAEAARSVTLYPQVTGIVAEVLFSAGEEIEAGAVLVRLEDDEQQVALDRARVTAEQARAALERAQSLAKTKTITLTALSDAETAAQLAEIEIRSADVELKRRAITAPFTGVAGLTDISLGDLVTTSTPITTLDDLATLQVDFEVPERWAGQIRLGHPIAAFAQGMPGSEFRGEITGIDTRIDAETRTLRLKAELVNKGQALKTGMAIAVAMQFESDKQLAVPTLAIQWDRRGSFVWKILDGVAHRVPVAIVKRQSGIVILKGELSEGDQVVVEGIHRLREGVGVAVVGAERGADPAAPADGELPAISRSARPAQTRS
jgi:RND family efflux transporter MFP subunit